jgi:hypothetical protein
MARDRRQLGKETVTFCDGDTREITIHAVPSFKMQQLRRLNRIQAINKKGEVEKVDFKDDEYVKSVLKLSTGTQMTTEDWEEVEDDLKDIYDRHFKKDLSTEKKAKLTDTSEPNQDNQSEE